MSIGYRLISDELHARDVCVSERRVWRICSKYRICSTIQRRYRTGKPASQPASDDLVRRQFHANAANVVWLTDIRRALDEPGQAVSVRGQGRVEQPDRRMARELQDACLAGCRRARGCLAAARQAPGRDHAFGQGFTVRLTPVH